MPQTRISSKVYEEDVELSPSTRKKYVRDDPDRKPLQHHTACKTCSEKMEKRVKFHHCSVSRDLNYNFKKSEKIEIQQNGHIPNKSDHTSLPHSQNHEESKNTAFTSTSASGSERLGCVSLKAQIDERVSPKRECVENSSSVSHSQRIFPNNGWKTQSIPNSVYKTTATGKDGRKKYHLFWDNDYPLETTV